MTERAVETVKLERSRLLGGVRLKGGRSYRLVVRRPKPGVFGQLSWSTVRCKVGEQVGLQAELKGTPAGPVELRIFEADAVGEPDLVETLQATVAGGTATARWTARYLSDRDDVDSSAELASNGYTEPELYFEAHCGALHASSGSAPEQLLRLADFIDLTVRDAAGKLMPNRPYTLVCADGSRREGRLDAQARLQADDIVPGPFFVRLAGTPTADEPATGESAANEHFDAPIDLEAAGLEPMPELTDAPAAAASNAGNPFGALRWSAKRCFVGDEVELQAELTRPLPSVQFEILEHDRDGQHDHVAWLDAKVDGSRAVARWQVEYVEDLDDWDSQAQLAAKGYTLGEFFFKAVSGRHQKTSGEDEAQLLHTDDVLDIHIEDPGAGPGRRYLLTLADGTTREGALSADGRIHEEGVAPGPYTLKLIDQKGDG